MVGFIIDYWVIRTLSLREAGSQGGSLVPGFVPVFFLCIVLWSSRKRALGPASHILGIWKSIVY